MSINACSRPRAFGSLDRRIAANALQFIVGCLFLVLQSVAAEAQDKPAHRSLNILLLSSYTQNYANSVAFEAGLDKALHYTQYEHNVYFEYFDAARLPYGDASAGLADHLRQKYRSIDFDYVIVWHLSAIQFVQEHPDIFPADKLIYFEGDGLSEEAKARIPAKWLNIFRDFTIPLTEMNRLYQPEKLYVVLDLSDINGQSRLDLFEAAKRQVFPDMEVEYLIDKPLTQIADVLKQPQKKRTAVVYLLTFSNTEGKPASPTEVIPYLAERSTIPIFTMWSAALNKGIVGGKMFSHTAAAESLGNQLLEAEGLKAPSPDNEINAIDNVYDWSALQRWHLDTSRVPADARIINKPVNLFYVYRYYLIVIAVVVALLAGLSILLSRALVARSHALKDLEQERSQLEDKVTSRTEELAAANSDLNERNQALTKSLDEIRTLKRIVPICSFCKNVRDDEGYWKMVDAYVSNHSGMSFSHGVCPECVKIQYPDLL